MEVDLLTKCFQDAASESQEFHEVLEIINSNSLGQTWLIGGFVYRSIAKRLYGSGKINVDLDFIIEAPTTKLNLPSNWTESVNHYSNPKLIKSDGLSIDFVPLEKVSSIARRNLPATIESFLTGTPLNIQSIAYELNSQKVIGNIGRRAILDRIVTINDPEQALIYASKKQKSIEEIVAEKAESLGFSSI